jgi:pyrroline-5-carboxylate reductase
MKIAILGCGGLGGAIARGLARASTAELALCDRHPEKLAGLNGTVHTSTGRAVHGADVVVLTVKPKGIRALVQEIAPELAPGALVVSCAAGVPVSAIAVPGRGAARAMPNIGASVGASTTAVLLGPGCERDRDWPRLDALFAAIGTLREVHDENLLHVVTGVAASAPAWLLLVVEAIVDGAVEMGLSRTEALAYAKGALHAASARLDGEPALVRAQVTSPGGTTAAGLARLEAGRVRAAFQDAVRAATARSRDLSG